MKYDVTLADVVAESHEFIRGIFFYFSPARGGGVVSMLRAELPELFGE